MEKVHYSCFKIFSVKLPVYFIITVYFSHKFSCIPSSPQTHHVIMDYLEFLILQSEQVYTTLPLYVVLVIKRTASYMLSKYACKAKLVTFKTKLHP